jgi:hypothetical protein
MPNKTSNWISAYDALPRYLRNKPLLEIALLEEQPCVTGQLSGFAGFNHTLAVDGSERALFYELGFCEVGGGGLHLGARSRGFGPIASPVLRTQIFPGNGAPGVGLQSYAVVWRERPLPSHPRADVAQIAISKGFRYSEVGFVVRDKLGKRVFEGWASFHASNLT